MYRNPAYYEGGTRALTGTPEGEKSPKSVLYDPYPEYNSAAWRGKWKGEYTACDGPRRRPLQKKNPRDMVSVYRGNQKGAVASIAHYATACFG